MGFAPELLKTVAGLSKEIRINPGNEVVNPSRIQTGSLALDVALGGGFPCGQWTEIYGEPSNGKALALDTPIPTPSGWTTMGDIQPGDVVFDELGQPTTVTFVTPVQMNRNCYEVRFNDGSTIIADADHQWTVTALSDGGRPSIQTLTTQQMVDLGVHKTGGHRRFRIANADPLVCAPTDLPVAPYTLGAWLGDGTAANGVITNPDPEVWESIQKDGFELSEKSIKEGSCEPHCALGLQPLLRALGVLGNKSIPQSYLRSSEEQRLALLQGLMDTDGSCSKAGQCEFSTTKKELADDVYELLVSMGIKVGVAEGVATLDGRETGPKWRLLFYTDLPVFRVARKAERLEGKSAKASYRARSIESITPVDSVPVKCIQVDSTNHLYLAGKAMVPTHNTAICLKSIAHNQAINPDFTAVWVAAEPWFPEWSAKLGIDNERVIVIQETIMEDVYEAVLKVLATKEVDLLVIDSLPALVSMAEDEKSMDEFAPGRNAFQTNKFFRKVTKALMREPGERQCACIMINQFRMKMGVMHGDPRTTPGGMGKDYAMSVRLEVKRVEWIEKGKGTGKRRIGIGLRAQTTKNKTFPPQQTAYVDFYMNDGGPVPAGDFDTGKEIATLAQVYGIVQRKASWYYFTEVNELEGGEEIERKWQGEDAMLNSLREEPLLAAQLDREVREVLALGGQGSDDEA